MSEGQTPFLQREVCRAGRAGRQRAVAGALILGALTLMGAFASHSGMSRELFTYEGSGTLFTRDDYCRVERLSIDELLVVAEEATRLGVPALAAAAGSATSTWRRTGCVAH